MQHTAQQRYDFYSGLNEAQCRVVAFNEGLCSVIGNPGSGKCVIGSSLILTNRGLVPIRSLFPETVQADTFYNVDNLRVASFDGPPEGSKVQSIYYNGFSEVVRVRTARGFELTAVEKEPLLLATAEGVVWEPIGSLRPGDYVGLHVGATSQLSGSNPMSPMLSYFLGALTSNGALVHQNFKIYHRDLNWLDQLGTLFEESFDLSWELFDKKDATTFMRLHGNADLERRLLALGVPLCSEPYKHVPASIMQSHRSSWAFFISGLFDGEGLYGQRGFEITLQSKHLMQDVQCILSALGIWSNLQEVWVGGNEHCRLRHKLTLEGEDYIQLLNIVPCLRRNKREYAIDLESHAKYSASTDIVPECKDLLRKTLKAQGALTRTLHLQWNKEITGLREPARNSIRELVEKTPASEPRDALRQMVLPDLRWDKVESITRLGEQPTYDMSVEDRSSFVANSLYAHNTTCIVNRIGRLVSEGVDPNRIMAMTFTRKAAAEMNIRLSKWGISGCRVGTIHSVCMQIAAAETKLMHCSVDKNDRMQWELKNILGAMRRNRSIPNRGVDFEYVRRFISSCKASGICYIDTDPFYLNTRGEQCILVNAKRWAAAAGLPPVKLLDIYRSYEIRRTFKGLMSFDDMLLWAWMSLISDEEARYKWRARWHVVIVDEAQDSNPVQWDVSRLLVGLDSCIPNIEELKTAPKEDAYSHNLMTVGDSSQAIFGFRDAEPSIFVDFTTNKRSTQIVLPINYRSNQTICAAGFSLVQGQQWHLGGAMESAMGDKPKDALSLTEYDNTVTEVSTIMDEIQEIAQDSGYKSCAVLSRLRVSLDFFELECIRRRIKYIKVPHGSFLESKEVKDILGYVRVAACLDPTGEYLRHIVNRPFRYFSRAFIDDCAHQAQLENRSLLDVMDACKGNLNRPQRMELNKLSDLIMKLNKMAVSMQNRAEKKEEGNSKAKIYTPADMVTATLKDTDYLESIRLEDGLIGIDESKKAMLVEINRMAGQFKTAYDFLTYVDALIVAIKRASKTGLRVKDETKEEDYLTLSTIHSAKGLEWPNVFIVDVVQGRFPCSMADDFDEELRLMYVALTRAMHRCKVSYSTVGLDDRFADPEITEAAKQIIMSPFVRKLKRFNQDQNSGANVCSNAQVKHECLKADAFMPKGRCISGGELDEISRSNTRHDET